LCRGKYSSYIDAYTFDTIKKYCGYGGLSRSTIDSWFVVPPTEEGEERKARIFPGLDEKGTKEMSEQLYAMRDIKFPSFTNLQSPRTSDYVSFSRCAVDILCWYDDNVVDELKKGNQNVETRAKLEDRLKLYFNPAGTAAIMLYVLRNYVQLYHHCRDVNIDDSEGYSLIFRQKIWYLLAKELMLSWKIRPMREGFYELIKKAWRKGIKVCNPIEFRLMIE
jgi:hypothetical protein